MKAKNILVITLGTALTLTSCSLDLEPMDGPSSQSFPATKAEAKSGLLDAYKGFANYTGNSTPWWEVMDNITDIGVTRVNTAKYAELITSAASGENACAVALFNNHYKTIAKVNLVLDNLDKAGMAEADLEEMRSELLAIRAFCYNDLVCHYGDVPYIDHTLSLSDNQYPRMAKEQVIENILGDLSDERLEWLPARHDSGENGSARIGRAAAYGLKARIALFWGRYKMAAEASAKALSLAKEAGYKLQPIDTSFCGDDHDAGEPTGQTKLFGYEGQESDEWLWAVQFNKTIDKNYHSGSYYHAARCLGGCAYWGPTQAFIDMFQCRDGKSVTESPLYDWQHPFRNRDPRLDLFCVRPSSRVMDIEFQTSTKAKKVKNYKTGAMITNLESQGTKGVYGANGNKGPGGYLWRKYIDPQELQNGAITSSSPCDLNEPLMRLAEIYLIEAEANIEMEGGDLELAREDINTIRRRVGMPDVEASSREALRKALRYERTVELCDEGFRWFDLRRWGMAETAMNGKIYAPAQDGAMSNAVPQIDDNWHVSYSDGKTWDGAKLNLRVYHDVAFRKGKDELWPLPQTLLDTNKEITGNNPGY